MLKTDILIIGTGIAGLSFAIKSALRRPDLKITIMTKRLAETSNTSNAQGGIAVVMDTVRDSFDKHIEDTLRAGGGTCDEDVVRMVVSQAPERLEELIRMGVRFDKTGNRYDLAREGGHTEHRILHRRDVTGREIEEALLRSLASFSNISVLENHFVIDLVVDKTREHHHCCGAFFFDEEQRIRYIRAKSTILSTGGCGQLFGHTTNATIATGDGVAMAWRAGASINDMQYIQFHPTAFYEPGKNPCFLISEVMRGKGAHVVDEEGKRFLFKYDVRGELATRDVVSKAIAAEMKRAGAPHMYLDCRHFDRDLLENHFPNILSYCRSKGIHPENQPIPIVPVAHYQCGGVIVNKDGQTTINRLYAIGECARTGLHGKNRLASNSLLEAVVFAHQASVSVCSTIDDLSHSTTVYVNKFSQASPTADLRKIFLLQSELKAVMDLFFIGSAAEKDIAHRRIRELKLTASTLCSTEELSVPLIELINMLTVAGIIIEQSKDLQTNKFQIS